MGESFFFTDFVEVGAKESPVDQSVEFGQEVVELIDFIELCFDLKERRMAFHKRRRNED